MNSSDCSQLPAPAEHPRLIIRTCAEVLENGRRCGCAAKHGERFCRHHIDWRKRRLRMLQAHRLLGHPRIPSLLDLQTVREAQGRLRYLRDAGYLDTGAAATLLAGLQMAANNLRFMEMAARWREREEEYR